MTINCKAYLYNLKTDNGLKIKNVYFWFLNEFVGS